MNGLQDGGGGTDTTTWEEKDVSTSRRTWTAWSVL